MASSRHTLAFFLDLNTPPSTSEPQQSAHAPAPAPALILNYPTLSVEQIMAMQSDIDANHFTLKSCAETVAAVSNLPHQLQNRTSEVHQLNTQLFLLQRMYKDGRVEISALKKQNKELKSHVTSAAQFGVLSYS
ncbi:hypothetical protein ACSBR2_001544 [Camellia fascicularis]